MWVAGNTILRNPNNNVENGGKQESSQIRPADKPKQVSHVGAEAGVMQLQLFDLRQKRVELRAKQVSES